MGEDQDDKAQDGHDAALSRDIQEQIGRRLRSELNVPEERPTFLGETTVPAQFEPLVRKLEAGERGQRQGYDAVKVALLRKAAKPRDETSG